MGFFFKDKPIDCYKKVNKLIEKMYYIKKSLIISAERSNDCDRHDICSRIDNIIDCYNSIVRMDFKGQYALMRSNVWLGSSVVDYECERLSIEDFMSKVFKEIEVIKRIAKGAPIVMNEVNPNSIPVSFFYDEHKLGVIHTLYINSSDFTLPPMFYV